MKYLIFISLFFWPLPVFAAAMADAQATYENALQDFNRGRFVAARRSAQTLGTADGYALACQTGLVIGGFREKGADAVISLHGALADCGKALELDSGNYSAVISQAIALGFEGLRLRKSTYARASRAEIETLIQQHPNNALAIGALGGWHAAVSREGMFARLVLGASRTKARDFYARAIELPRAELPLYFEFIRFLASGNREDRMEAARVLDKALKVPPKNALEKLLIEKCLQIQEALKSDGRKKLDNTLSAVTPFNDIDVWGTAKKTGIKAFPIGQRLLSQRLGAQ